jgi:putative transcriptional regulator
VDDDEFLFIEDQEDLHRAIALNIIERGDGMTGRELWFVRQELGLSQAQLARFIHADVQAVARWEKGKSRIPGPADRLVRILYLNHAHGDVDVASCSCGSTKWTPRQGIGWFSSRQPTAGT